MAIGLLALAGCDQGTGSVAGDWLEVPGCDGPETSRRFEPFHLHLARMGAEQEGDVLVLRFAPEARHPIVGDQLVVIVEGVAAARAEIAAAGTTTWDLGGPPTLGSASALPPGAPQVRAALALIGRCETPSASLIASGTATLTALGADAGEPVRGALSFDVLDARDGALLGEGFEAAFDFEVEANSPYRTYAPVAP
ncbi:MAG: hypothetical protein EP329_23155 [Deltaproteobacteria bacterium]|nr:MAG: hypothetical protein EP329_23155 [Deltaproteobacteria bacterium]